MNNINVEDIPAEYSPADAETKRQVFAIELTIDVTSNTGRLWPLAISTSSTLDRLPAMVNRLESLGYVPISPAALAPPPPPIAEVAAPQPIPSQEAQTRQLRLLKLLSNHPQPLNRSPRCLEPYRFARFITNQ